MQSDHVNHLHLSVTLTTIGQVCSMCVRACVSLCVCVYILVDVGGVNSFVLTRPAQGCSVLVERLH